MRLHVFLGVNWLLFLETIFHSYNLTILGRLLLLSLEAHVCSQNLSNTHPRANTSPVRDRTHLIQFGAGVG